MLIHDASTPHPAVRVARVSEFNVLVSMKHRLWGASRARFRKWEIGDYLVLKDASGPIAIARVTGKPFQSMARIWGIDVFPYRISMEFLHFLAPEDRPEVAVKFKQLLVTGVGFRYGIRVRTQTALPKTTGLAVIKLIRSRPNLLAAIQRRIDSLIAGDYDVAEIASRGQ
jgi:hypothetical protein